MWLAFLTTAKCRKQLDVKIEGKKFSFPPGDVGYPNWCLQANAPIPCSSGFCYNSGWRNRRDISGILMNSGLLKFSTKKHEYAVRCNVLIGHMFDTNKLKLWRTPCSMSSKILKKKYSVIVIFYFFYFWKKEVKGMKRSKNINKLVIYLYLLSFMKL